ncbi:MAG: DUF177 domain-containing protein [Clostridia bacterium]|nr:DUF177 domain-containing protein [Clostridia bacterium]
MILELKSVFATEGKQLPVNCCLDMSNEEFMGLFPLKKPVTAKGSIFNRASVVSLNLEISFEYVAPCDRCGKETACLHNVTFNKSLATSIEGEDSDTIIIVPDMRLDVDELIFSEVILDLPTKHLCSETCKGICYLCGKDLNEGDCDCDHKEIDPRLQKLADLLNN